MKLRFRIPGLAEAEREALERRTRLFLGRHGAEIEAVEFSVDRETRPGAAQADCELAVKLRDGGAVRVHDDADHLQRALLRAAWRIDQRRQLGPLRRNPAART